MSSPTAGDDTRSTSSRCTLQYSGTSRCYCFRRLGPGSPDWAGTHPARPGGTSARPSICVRSSSRKRAQSARRSSETNSPGSSDSWADVRSGCCSGSRNHSPLAVETVDNSCVCEPRALHASGSGDEVAAQLYAVAPGAPTTQTFGATSPTGGRGRTRRSRLFVEAGAGRKRLPHDALGVGERLPSPRLYTHCWQGHKTESSSANASH